MKAADGASEERILRSEDDSGGPLGRHSCPDRNEFVLGRTIVKNSDGLDHWR